jgi:hypothetical protein
MNKIWDIYNSMTEQEKGVVLKKIHSDNSSVPPEPHIIDYFFFKGGKEDYSLSPISILSYANPPSIGTVCYFHNTRSSLHPDTEPQLDFSKRSKWVVFDVCESITVPSTVKDSLMYRPKRKFEVYLKENNNGRRSLHESAKGGT